MDAECSHAARRQACHAPHGRTRGPSPETSRISHPPAVISCAPLFESAFRAFSRAQAWLWFAALSSLFLGGMSICAQNLTNGLASQWVADDYAGGGSWIDRVRGTVAASDGAPVPLAVSAAFGIHKGVQRSAGAGGTGGFLIPAANPPTGLTNYTLAVVFAAATAGPGAGAYYSSQIIFGYDTSGAGQPDWGISWGGNGSRAGQGVVAGIGWAGGDSPLVSANSPMALNATHVAVLQVNGSNSTMTLFVDGVQASQASGITILAPTNSNGTGAIPLLSIANSTIGAAFTGAIAEVRVYTNATVSGTALGIYLQNGYAKLSPILLTATPALVYRGGPVTLQVTVPAAATQGGPFPVTLFSDNPGVVASTNVVLAAGTTSTNLVVPVGGVGTANITASGAGLLASTPLVVSGVAAGSVMPTAWFKADVVRGVSNGAALATWPDLTGNGYNATQGSSSQQPTFVTNAMNGLPVLRFNSANSTCLALTRPIQDDFSIVCVFQSTQGLGSGNLFYQGAGLVNAEVGGVVDDFGTCLFANGSVAAGTGNPDVAVDSNPGYNDGRPHVMTFSRSRSTGLVALYMDGALAGTTTGGTQSLTSPSQLLFGAQQTFINYFSGDIAEVAIFNVALSDTNRQSVESPLFQKYNLPPPAPAGLYLQLQNGGVALTWLASSGATGYHVKRGTTSGGPYTVIATNSATLFTDATASPTNTYYYVVSAFNGSSESVNSTEVNTESLLGFRYALGPSSRKTPITISEILWKPAPRLDNKNLEFIEIYNSNPWYHDLSGYRLTCADMNYVFPAGTRIASNSFLVIAAAPSDLQSVYGITNVTGPYTGSLKKSESLQLLDEQGAVLLTVPYSDVFPWPVAADGTGHSIVLGDPTYGEGDPRAWSLSDAVGGTPGQREVFHPGPLRNVVINEILPHSEDPAVPQFIELYNHSSSSVDVSGCILTDDPTTNKFVFPAGTLVAPAGFVSFTGPQVGFTLNGAGETLYLIQPDGTRVLDAVQFGAQSDGVAYGRWPDGANEFYALARGTPGTNNSPILIGDIVINELMYNPISGNDDDQYIELFNQGARPVNLANWQFTSAVTFTFPSVTLAPNSYLVVARNLTNLLGKYTNLTRANTVGNYTGKLSHKGELLVLSMPQTLHTNTAISVAEDQVAYGTGGRWGQWAGGGGSSLELIDPRANHRLASNWADSDESQKSSWTNLQFTGTLDNGANYGSSIGYAQIGILDVGECLVDNVEVDDVNGVNYVSNPTFETGLANWSPQGDCIRSSLESSGYASSFSLHVRCSDRYYNAVNSCQVALNSNSLAAGQTATLRFKARWICGWPEAILRLNGGWLEATGAMPVPSNLGTPGMPNSRQVASAGPAIFNVTHFPSVPAANQSVVVTAQVHEANGVQALLLNYRVDPSTNYTSVAMKDDGTGGDGIAGDGVFSATIPGQSLNTLVAFYLSATGSNSVASRFPALLTDNSPSRDCLAMFGDGNPGGSFSVYHLWLTQSNITRWANLGNLSNEGIDCTMVNGNRVIYNAQAHFQGSPVHQGYDTPNGSWCTYKWIFQDDDKFLGATSFNKIHWPGNTANDPTIQREQLANAFLRALGVPWLNRRYVVVYVNGNRRGTLMEDAQTPDNDMVKEYFPNDSNGYLRKVNRWYEFAPSLSGEALPVFLASEAMIMPYTTTGGAKKPGRYRFAFEYRTTADSANNLTDLFSLIDAASSQGSPDYVRNLGNLADMENWMRVFAANHAAGNWDSFGCSSGQNLYAYTGTLGTRCTLMMFDFNIGLGSEVNYPPGQNLFTTVGGDNNIAGIYNEATFRRMYWRALGELVANGPLNLSLSTPLLNAKFATFTANGLSVEDPNLNLIPWLAQASPLVAAQVTAANATNFAVNPTIPVTNNVAVLTGQAPFNVDTIWVNGAAYPLTWTTVTNWVMTVPLQNGTNQLAVVGVGRNGQPIAGDNAGLSVSYSATNPSPIGQVVLNEIQYHAPVAGAEFVELFNNSTNTTFDLSDWQVRGLAYTFPSGSLIGPGRYLVLAANDQAFAGAYGATNPVFDTFSGTLFPSGTLALLTSSNVIVAEVKYESQLPWPTNANGTGPSLQLIDPRQDNWRVGNWSTRSLSATPGAANSVASVLAPFPPLWINELQADNRTGITNRAGQHTAWVELYNPGTNPVALNGLYLANNYTNLLQWAFPANAVISAGQFEVIFADALTNLTTTSEWHTSFALGSGTGSLALTRLATNGQPQVLDYVNYANVMPNNSFGSVPDGQGFTRQELFQATPGGPNNGTSTPPASFIDYALAGSVYTQNFDALPNPGAVSVNSANPVTINGTTYSLPNPFDFAYPISAATSGGGLGLGAMAGWYGSGALAAKFGATDGDQTTGGQLSFGLPGSSNRSLGLLATSSTGGTAFGVRFINGTPMTLTRMNLQFSGQVWRQSNLAKSLRFSYSLDRTGTNGFPASATAFLPALDVNLPPVAADVGGLAVDGTSSLNQTNLGVFNQAITNWPPGAALWLVWQMADPTGKAQGLGIDNLLFSAAPPPPPPVSVQLAGTNVFLTWPTTTGASYQLEYKNTLAAGYWTAIGSPFTGSGQMVTLTNAVGPAAQCFYRFRLLNWTAP